MDNQTVIHQINLTTRTEETCTFQMSPSAFWTTYPHPVCGVWNEEPGQSDMTLCFSKAELFALLTYAVRQSYSDKVWDNPDLEATEPLSDVEKNAMAVVDWIPFDLLEWCGYTPENDCTAPR